MIIIKEKEEMEYKLIVLRVAQIVILNVGRSLALQARLWEKVYHTM